MRGMRLRAAVAGGLLAAALLPVGAGAVELPSEEPRPAAASLPATGGDTGEARPTLPAPVLKAEPTRVLRTLKEIGQGIASWYGPGLHGRKTASGERFDQHALTAAHRSLPFGTIVRVTSLVNGKSVDVRINDRGPMLKRRIIDLSRAAAEALGLIESGMGIKQVTLAIVSDPGVEPEHSESAGADSPGFPPARE